MRIEITMRVDEARSRRDDTGRALIPINYQYQMSREIYRRILRHDRGYANMLRDHGAEHGYKSFKLFTFSRLSGDDIKPVEINGRMMLAVGPGPVRMTVSMVSGRLFEILFWGNQRDRSLKLEEARFSCYMNTIPEPPICRQTGSSCNALRLRTISPVVLSRRVYRKGVLPRKSKDRFKEVYMSPDDPEYFEYLKRNIEEKYTAWKSALGEPVYSIEKRLRRTGTIRRLRSVSKPRPSLTTLKEGRRDETRVRGWSYELEIEGYREILEFAYSAGLGKMNSMGFGCVEVI